MLKNAKITQIEANLFTFSLNHILNSTRGQTPCEHFLSTRGQTPCEQEQCVNIS